MRAIAIVDADLFRDHGTKVYKTFMMVAHRVGLPGGQPYAGRNPLLWYLSRVVDISTVGLSDVDLWRYAREAYFHNLMEPALYREGKIPRREYLSQEEVGEVYQRLSERGNFFVTEDALRWELETLVGESVFRDERGGMYYTTRQKPHAFAWSYRLPPYSEEGVVCPASELVGVDCPVLRFAPGKVFFDPEGSILPSDATPRAFAFKIQVIL